MESFGPTILRVMVGIIFIAHGSQKLFGAFGGAGLNDTAASLEAIGLTPGLPMAVAVGGTEFAGGLLMVAGAFTGYAAAALVAVMLGAMWKIHLVNGFFVNWALTPGRGHGVEFNLILIAALVCLALGGPGALSVDHSRLRSAEADAAGRARLRHKL